MLTTLPTHVPPLSILLDNIGARPAQIAHALNVSERSVRRWISKDQAPQSVLLALFFCSTWGRSAVHCEAENAARLYTGLARCLLEERGQRLVTLRADAANSSQWDRPRPKLATLSRAP